MVSLAGKMFAFVTAVYAYMISFLSNFIKIYMKRIFIVSNFDQFFKNMVYMFGNSF